MALKTEGFKYLCGLDEPTLLNLDIASLHENLAWDWIKDQWDQRHCY